MNLILNTITWLNRLSLKHKVSLGLFFSLLITLTGVLCWSILTPSYAVLFSHLDEKDASQIVKQLESEKISYQIKKEGSEILIDKPLVNSTRLKLMGNGMQWHGNIGFELFDKSDFGMTDFSQKINYQRAIQGELERTISSLEEVRQARVHLATPEHHLFDSETNPPKASIILHLKKSLSPQQIESIQQLVASSVNQLNQKNVVIIDQFGNTLSRSINQHAQQQLTAKQAIERYLTDKVIQMLIKIFNEEQVMVRVDAVLNHNELRREFIKPQAKGYITHEKEIKRVSPGKTEKDKKEEDWTREKSYQFGQEKEFFKQARGTIDRLSISVVLPTNSTPQTIEKIRQIVKNTVGFNEKRGDSISVEALITTTNPTSQTLITEAPIPSQVIKPSIALEIVVAILCVFSALATVLIRKINHKKRKLLLIELRQWLNEHE